MKRTMRRALVVSAAMAIVVSLVAMAPSSPQRGGGSPAWETMKSLQGEWDGLYGGKMKTTSTYKLVSNGTALMETLVSPESTDMVTMYHPDGNSLVMTHYCSESTQSRMRAPGSDTRRIVFSFMDATNAASPDAMRMTGLVLTVKDHDHMTAEWTSSGMGKSGTGVFEFTRRK